jgi:membrane protease YdiL (CAAX protease family)
MAKHRLLWSFLYVLFGGLVFVLGLNLLNWVPEAPQDGYKLGLPILFLVLFFVSQKYFPKHRTIFWAFFLVSVGWLLDYYLTGKVAAWLSLDSNELSGLAYTMVISAFLITTPVIVGWILSGRRLTAIYIQRSNKRWGIVVGVIGLVLLGGLGVLQAQDQGMALKAIGAAVPLALVFSIANAFREELVYRAVLLKGYQVNIGTIAAIAVTTVVFAAAHIDVSYDPASLLMFAVILVFIGALGSLIMLKTGSLIGAVLFHAGADVLLILGMLSSQQLMLT